MYKPYIWRERPFAFNYYGAMRYVKLQNEVSQLQNLVMSLNKLVIRQTNILQGLIPITQKVAQKTT
jgi:hypothetical protein